MRSEPAVYDSDDAWVYIHPYPPVISVTYTVFCWNSVNVSDDDMKSVKSMSRSFFFLSDFFCVRCAYIVLFYNTSTTRPRPRPAYKGKPSKEQAAYNSDDAWVYIYSSYLSVVSLDYVASVEIVSTSPTTI